MRVSIANRSFGHRWFTVCTLLALASGCASPQKIIPHPGIKIAEAKFRDQISTLCLLETSSELGFEESDERMSKFAELLAKELEALGFAVVPASEVDATWDAVREAEGGYFDLHTGTIDTARWDAVSEKFYAEIKRVHSCDATVFPSLVVVNAGVGGEAATWDHRRTKFRLMFTGHIPAISVRIVINNGPKSEIYYGVGGIQLAQELKQDKFTEAHFAGIESDRIFEHWTDTEEGVRLALRDLARVMRADDSPEETSKR